MAQSDTHSLGSPVVASRAARAEAPHLPSAHMVGSARSPEGGPVLLTQRAVGVSLGLSASVLSRLQHVHPIWHPAVVGIPGVPRGGPGASLRRYHVVQLALLEAVMVGVLSPDEAFETLRLQLALLGRAAPAIRTGGRRP